MSRISGCIGFRSCIFEYNAVIGNGIIRSVFKVSGIRTPNLSVIKRKKQRITGTIYIWTNLGEYFVCYEHFHLIVVRAVNKKRRVLLLANI